MAVKLAFRHINDNDHTLYTNFYTIPVVKTVDAELYEPCTLKNPKFLLAYDSDILKCNYCSCTTATGYSQFNRKYFITNVTFQSGGQMVIECKTDLLNTLGQQLFYSPVVISRATTVNNKPTFVKDTQLPLYVDKDVKSYALMFEGGKVNPFMTGSATQGDYLYVFNVAGGQAVTPE